jgi:tripartite-type tricarboxylate transporter receptor subunit TctC
MRTLLSTAVGALAFFAVAAPALSADEVAQANFDAAKYFAGKNIRVIVGFTAGGGTDLQARHFAAHWGDHMPGKPRFTVTNITPNTTAGNRLYASDPDGFTLEMTAGSDVVGQFMESGAKYKAEENRVIGTHTGSSSVWFVRKGWPHKTIADAVNSKEVIRVGFRGPQDAYAMRLSALSKWLNFPIKFIPGLSGTTENMIALERGDTDGYLAGGGGTVWFSLPTIRPGWLKDGTIRAYAQMSPADMTIGENKEVGRPQAPRAQDLIKDPEQKRLFEILTNADTRFGKVWIAPPKTPDHIINVYRKAYEDLLANKPFRDKLEELMGEPVQYTHGAEVEKAIDEMVKGFGANVHHYKEWVTWAQERS